MSPRRCAGSFSGPSGAGGVGRARRGFAAPRSRVLLFRYAPEKGKSLYGSIRRAARLQRAPGRGLALDLRCVRPTSTRSARISHTTASAGISGAWRPGRVFVRYGAVMRRVTASPTALAFPLRRLSHSCSGGITILPGGFSRAARSFHAPGRTPGLRADGDLFRPPLGAAAVSPCRRMRPDFGQQRGRVHRDGRRRNI
jgi:hypothetical protein